MVAEAGAGDLLQCAQRRGGRIAAVPGVATRRSRSARATRSRCPRCGRSRACGNRRRCCRSCRRWCIGCTSRDRVRTAGPASPRPAAARLHHAGFARSPSARLGSTASTRFMCRLKSRTSPVPTALPATDVPPPRAGQRHALARGTPPTRPPPRRPAAAARPPVVGTRYSDASDEYAARVVPSERTSATPARRSAAGQASAEIIRSMLHLQHATEVSPPWHATPLLQ